MFKKCKNNKLYIKKRIKTNKKDLKGKNDGFVFILHPLTFLLLVLSAYVGMFWLFILYLCSLLVHEFSHMLIAKKRGYICSKITLYPTGALLYGETDEFAFKDEILIALAGPLSNIVLCVLCVFVWWIYPYSYNFTTDFVVANLSLAIFNLLPIYPLDGGRVVLAFLSLYFSRKQAAVVTKNITIIVSIILFAVFVVSIFFTPNFSIGITSVVIFISVIGEEKQSAYKRLAKTDLKKRKLKHGLKVVSLMFLKQTKLSNIVSKIDNYAYYIVLIVDDSFNVLTKLTEQQIYELSLNNKLSETIGDILKL